MPRDATNLVFQVMFIFRGSKTTREGTISICFAIFVQAASEVKDAMLVDKYKWTKFKNKD